MASSLHFTNPTLKDWMTIYQLMDQGKLQDQVIYKKGQEVFGTRNKEEISKDCEVLSKGRIIEILHSEKNKDPTLSISSKSFDPLKASRTSREEYLELNQQKPWVRKFLRFEIKLNELLMKKGDELENGIADFVGKYGKKYHFSELDFTPLFINHADPHVKEKLLNLALNKYRNDQEINEFIEGNKKEIIENFAPDLFKEKLPTHFTFKMEFLGKETHNLGKLPAKIIFSYQGKEIFSVVYKPRAAVIDIAVLALLAQFKLPTLKIKSYETENKSIWQYIKGEDMLMVYEGRLLMKTKDRTSSIAPEVFIMKSTTLKENQRKPLLDQLNWLNNIFLCINISDLHGENIRLGVDGAIYPIDLEVMDERVPTYLMKDDYFKVVYDVIKSRSLALSQFKQHEKDLINNWLKSAVDLTHGVKFPVRHVLVGTGKLFQINSLVEFEKASESMFNLITSALTEHGYEFTETQKNIVRNQVYIDLLNGDVPFFTECSNVIYYGHVNKNYAIGQKKIKGGEIK